VEIERVSSDDSLWHKAIKGYKTCILTATLKNPHGIILTVPLASFIHLSSTADVFKSMYLKFQNFFSGITGKQFTAQKFLSDGERGLYKFSSVLNVADTLMCQFHSSQIIVRDFGEEKLKKQIDSKEENNVQQWFWKMKMFPYFNAQTFDSLVEYSRNTILPETKFSNNKRTSISIMKKCMKVLDKLEARVKSEPERFFGWYKYIDVEFCDKSNNRHERLNRKMRDKLQLLPAGSTERKILSQKKAFHSCATDFQIEYHSKTLKRQLEKSSKISHERFYNACLNVQTECSIKEIYEAI
jgi:hypothetical protein